MPVQGRLSAAGSFSKVVLFLRGDANPCRLQNTLRAVRLIAVVVGQQQLVRPGNARLLQGCKDSFIAAVDQQRYP